MMDALTRWPSLSNSPWIRLYPQPWFSVASRSISAAISALTVRPSCPVRVAPLASDQTTVPAQDGAGGDQPVHPQPCRQEPDQRGEDRPVGPIEPGPRMSAAQHGDLMPQHEQLRVLGGRRPAKQDQPAADPDEDEIEQAQRHG